MSPAETPCTNHHRQATVSLPIYLGCPVWACGDWGGQVYPEKSPRSAWLQWYSRTFNTVEGNSTFYALPSLESTQRWVEQTADGFRFAFKFPRLISHELELAQADEPTSAFLHRLEPLAQADRLGPTFLQLGPRFGPDRFDWLRRYLMRLSRESKWAVEVRHHGWYDAGTNEHRLNDLLAELEIDKVLFDSRPLFDSAAEDETEAASRLRKPKTPVRQTVTGRHPMLRIVGRNRAELADHFFDQWAPIVARWIGDGLVPYIFTHAPSDSCAPALARRFADRLQQQLPEADFRIPKPPAPARQLSLLGDD
jgi:uncharacterized protein YecE (DUF72 family)